MGKNESLLGTSHAFRQARLVGAALLSLALGGAACNNPAGRLYAVGEKALAAGDPVKAIIAFNHARELRPGDYRYTQAVWRARARLLAESVDRITVENQEENRFQVEQLLESEPQNATYLVAMAHVLEHARDRAGAARQLDAAVKADPKCALAHLARAAFIERTSNKADEAIAEFQQALASEPGSLVAHLGLGRLYMLKKDSTKEIEEFTKAQSLDPESYTANELLADAYLRAAEAASSVDEKQAKLVSALKSYMKAAAVDPANPEPHWGLAMIDVQAARWKEAEGEVRLAMKGKRFPEMDFQLGLTLARQNRCAEAMPQFQLFLRQQPDHPAALYELAACATTLGRKDDAIAYYKKMLSLPLPADGDPHRAETVERNKVIESKLAALTAAPKK